ncbi:MAG: peptidoglycan-binding protein, partial [Verrucomicrobia bacterium]|nr:peptidoglycan-binding protein [Verrucomicrobiota bacterium]
YGRYGYGRYGYGRYGYGYRGRFYYGPGFSFYGYGYPWWGWDYPYYSDAYYGYDPYYSGSYEGDHDPRLTSTRAVQAALAWQGYYSGRIDGIMGPETREAIRAFQKNRGLPATGQIDSRLIGALRP